MRSSIQVLIGFLALLLIAWSALSVFAGGMSDDIETGREWGAKGGVGFIVGVVVLLADIATAFV